MENLVTIVTVGHVDHGKSSVIGRLLADANVLPKGKLETVKRNCELNSRPFEYAFLLDALKCEQSQGITLDIARCFFNFKNKRYEILDAPGHLELLKNMVTGASRADAAILIIDASRGIEENTRQHCYYLKMLGINQLAVIINKMDLVAYSEKIYYFLKKSMEDFLSSIEISALNFIPTSSINGDNIVNKSSSLSFYNGPTVIEQFNSFSILNTPESLPFRMPIQGVYKFTENGDTRRIVAGSLISGTLNKHDSIIFYPSGKKTNVKSLTYLDNKEKSIYTAGEAAGFTMTDEIILSRGDIACKIGEIPPLVSVKIKANIFWLGDKPLMVDKPYILKICTARTEVTITEIHTIINASTLYKSQRNHIEKNEVATVTISLERPIAFDIGADKLDMGRFVLIDDYEISGGGTIIESLADDAFDLRNLKRSSARISVSEKEKVLGKGAVLWFTGLSGSGKTTIASGVEYALTELGIHSYILDGDELRTGLNSDLGFSDTDRTTNILRTAHVAKMFKNAGIITMVTLISPFSNARNDARKIIGTDFYEIFVSASISECRKRDPKKLYAKADSGKLQLFTGNDSPYEIPSNPELIINTETLSEFDAVNQVLALIKKILKL